MDEPIQQREHHGVAALADSILAGPDGGWEFLDPSGDPGKRGAWSQDGARPYVVDGDLPMIFAVDPATGAVAGTITLPGASHRGGRRA